MSKQLSKKPNKKRFYRRPIAIMQAVAVAKPVTVPSITLKFPSIPRIIPEVRRLARAMAFDLWVIIGFVTGIILMGIIISSFQLEQSLKELKQAQSYQLTMSRQIAYWQQVIKMHPDYRDGYFALANLTYRIGDTVHARNYLKKVLSIDPQFGAGKAMASQLTK